MSRRALVAAALLPSELAAAYDWTAAAGEIAELREMPAAAVPAYCLASAENALAHGDLDVTEDDLLALAAWLRGES